MIIGISGKIHCGKTVLTRFILDNLVGYVRKAFGDLLKYETAQYFNFPLDLCYSQHGKNQIVEHKGKGMLPPGNYSVRELLQWYGTDYARAQDEHYWVKAMGKHVDKDVVIDDVRFPNEARFVLDNGGLLVRLNPYAGWEPGEFANHESETALDNWSEWGLVMAPQFGELEAAAKQVIQKMEDMKNA